jgi:hypothetical protein
MDIDWGSKVINAYRDTDTFFAATADPYVWDMDVDEFRKQLRDLEDNEDGMPFPDTHNHNTEVTLGSLTIARVVEIINGYTIQFWPMSPHWTVNILGANNNVDVVKVTDSGDTVDTRQNNSAGLVSVPIDTTSLAADFWGAAIENGYTAEQMWRLMMAALVGKVNGANSTEMRFRDDADSKDRITVTVDLYGNRQAVVKDPD